MSFKHLDDMARIQSGAPRSSLASAYMKSSSTLPPAGRGQGGRTDVYQPPRTDFGPPPEGYVAGAGRGLGPVRVEGAALDGGARKYMFTALQRAEKQFGMDNMGDDGDRQDYSDSQFDKFGGYQGSLFASTPYGQDDKEADAIWSQVEEKVSGRAAKRKSDDAQGDAQATTTSSSSAGGAEKKQKVVADSFADLRDDLKTIGEEEWAAIPEIGDRSLRFKQQEQRYMPAPDSLLDKVRQDQEKVMEIDAADGAQTAPVLGDLNEVGKARKTVLDLQLKEKEDSVSGQTNVDPKGYITEMGAIDVASATISDIEKARLLLRSVTTTNPHHAPGWIAFARLEQRAGKGAKARSLIDKGCAICADSEDVWLEASRLHVGDAARAVVARAVQRLPQSVKLWMRAAEMEETTDARRLVLRKALECVPNSVQLWKAAVRLESPADARILLARAVECVPRSVDMWLALAKLETYGNARKVLNKARKALPAEPKIWVTAARLEEANGNVDGVDRVVQRAVTALAQHASMEREQWLAEAAAAERAQSPETARAIVHATMEMGVEVSERKRVWLADAEAMEQAKQLVAARAVLDFAVGAQPHSTTLWARRAEFELQHGTREQFHDISEKALAACPQSEALWLMAARERAQCGESEAARALLVRAFKANPDSEHIWLAAVRLEVRCKELTRARHLLARARQACSTPRVWQRSAQLERSMGNVQDEITLLDEAIALFTDAPRLRMMRAQAALRADGVAAARAHYNAALNACPQSIDLWLCAVRLECDDGAWARARSLLERARLANPKNDVLWREACRVELGAGNSAVGEQVLAKALQECPTSGLLWAHAINTSPSATQRAKCVDALRKCDNDVHVVLAVARGFWHARRVDKARVWLNRAVKIDPTLGDAWSALYQFELGYGDAKSQQAVVARCEKAEPVYGEEWTAVSKDWTLGEQSTAEILKRVAARGFGAQVPAGVKKEE